MGIGLIGAVVIGRNEGDRLNRCLRSLVSRVECTVYVDSGSTDGSVEFARRMGIRVIELDKTQPFTMARGRNAGFNCLDECTSALDYVQFVDGDCEVVDGWIEEATVVLNAHPEVGSVSGHRFEIAPKASIYNRLADMDWRGQCGEVMFLGGDVMMRVDAYRDIGGYRERMIAGEDPEICVRLRSRGWKLLRLDLPMTRHDAAMTSFSQWWKRTVRAGHAYAEGMWLHRKSREQPWRREVRRNWLWGMILPLLIIGAAWPTAGHSLVLTILYPIWMWKIARERKRHFGEAGRDVWLYAAFCMLAKIPSAIGQLLFWLNRLRGKQTTLIEYKTTESNQAESENS